MKGVFGWLKGLLVLATFGLVGLPGCSPSTRKRLRRSSRSMRNHRHNKVIVFASKPVKRPENLILSYTTRKPLTTLIVLVVLASMMIAQTVFLIASCASNPSATFKNPRFRCPSGDVVEPDEGDPSPVQAYPPPGGQRSVAELKDFCERMKQRFADSNLTVEEAEQFYALLKENNEKTPPEGRLHYFNNGTYGFPTGSGDPFVFEKQVMLKRISEEKYEIFYYHIDCGRNYTHMEAYLENGNLIEVVELESWRENYPC